MKKFIALFVALILLLSIGVFSACFVEEEPSEDNNITYTITFNDGNGGMYSPISVKYSEIIIGLPIAIAPEDKQFDGWKTEDGMKVIEGMTYIYLKDIELTAIFIPKEEKNDWENITYTITFNDGNAGVYTPISIKYSEVIGQLPIAITPNDKEFIGWITNSGINITENMTFTYVNDIELTAIFVDKKFTITIQNTTNASFTEWVDGMVGNKVVEVEIGGKLNIPKIKYEEMSSAERNYHDYRFKGWFYKDRNGNERQLNLNMEITLENLSVNTYEIVVYAKVSRQWIG